MPYYYFSQSDLRADLADIRKIFRSQHFLKTDDYRDEMDDRMEL